MARRNPFTLSCLLTVGEIAVIALWTAIITRPYLNLDPNVVPNGREYLSAIQSHQMWTTFRRCGLCLMWDGSERGGSPAFADPFGSMLHPFVVASTLRWGVINGSKMVLAASFLLAGLAQWWLARVLGLGRPARLWAACMAVAAGNLSTRMEAGWIGVVLSTASCALVLPPLLWLARAASRRAAAALGVTLALAFVAGQGYVQLALLLTLPAALLLLPASGGRALLVLRRFALAGGIALLLASPLLVPLWHFLPTYGKLGDSKFGSAQPFAYLPLNLVIGDPAFYHSEALHKLPYPAVYGNYVGWLAVLLAVFALTGGQSRNERRMVWFLMLQAIMALWFASAAPFIWITKVAPSSGFAQQLASLRFPSLMAGLAVPDVLALAAVTLDRLLRRGWRPIEVRLTSGNGWTFRPDLRWLATIPLLWALSDVRAFGANWTVTSSLGADVSTVLAALRTPDAEWVNPPFGEHYWIASAVASGLKLAGNGTEQLRWRDRGAPLPVLEAARSGSPSGMAFWKSVAQIPIYRASGRDYAAVEYTGGRVACHAKSAGGDINVACDAPADGNLVVEENSWSGWRAAVDGRGVALRPGRWLSVALPAGRHTISFRYRPWDVPLGLALAVIGLGLAAYNLRKGGVAGGGTPPATLELAEARAADLLPGDGQQRSSDATPGHTREADIAPSIIPDRRLTHALGQASSPATEPLASALPPGSMRARASLTTEARRPAPLTVVIGARLGEELRRRRSRQAQTRPDEQPSSSRVITWELPALRLAELVARLRTRKFSLFAAIAGQILLLLVWLWVRNGFTSHVTVTVHANHYQALTDGHLLAEGDMAGPPNGGVGLDLKGPGTLPTAAGPPAVREVTVTDLDSGKVLFHDDFQGGKEALARDWSGGWAGNQGPGSTDGRAPWNGGRIVTGLRPWTNYRLDAVIANPITVRAYVRFQNLDNAVHFDIRPWFDLDSSMGARVSGRDVASLPTKRPRVSALQSLRGVLGVILRPYPALVVTVLVALGLQYLLSRIPLPGLVTVAGEKLVRWLSGGRAWVANVAAVFLAAGATAGLAYASTTYLERIPHVPDAVVYLFQAKELASARIAAPAAAVRELFDVFPAGLYYVNNHWVGQYPFGHPLMLAVGVKLGAAWLVPPVIGGGCVLLLYFLGCKLYGIGVGLLAAALLLASPFFQMNGVDFMSHNTGAFYLIIAAGGFAGMLGGSRGLRRSVGALTTPPAVAGEKLRHEVAAPGHENATLSGSAPFEVGSLTRRLIKPPGCVLAGFISGVALGLLFNTRPLTGFAVALYFGAILAVVVVRSRTWRPEFTAFAAGGLLLIMAYFGYNWLMLGNPLKNAYSFNGTLSANTIGFGGANTVQGSWSNTYTNMTLLEAVLFAWRPGLAAFFVLLPFVLRSRNRWDYFTGGLVVVIMAGWFFYDLPWVMYGPRMWYETAPFLVLLVARGAFVGAERTAELAWRLRTGVWKAEKPSIGEAFPVPLMVSGMLVLAGLSSFSWWGPRNPARPGYEFTPGNVRDLKGFNFSDARVQTAVRKQGLHDALVLIPDCGGWWCNGVAFSENDPGLTGDVLYARDLGSKYPPDRLAELFPGRQIVHLDYNKLPPD